jgi:hypothetical protein
MPKDKRAWICRKELRKGQLTVSAVSLRHGPDLQHRPRGLWDGFAHRKTERTIAEGVLIRAVDSSTITLRRGCTTFDPELAVQKNTWGQQEMWSELRDA